jgi:hypothetical protein
MAVKTTHKSSWGSMWWRVVAPDGSIWCETSVESEAREAMRPGDYLWRLWQRTEEVWMIDGDEPK